VNTFEVHYTTNINLNVTVEADDEDQAQDVAWDAAQSYLSTVVGDHQMVTADASLDGVGADEIEEVGS
jgi:hypothetical protein